jgi:hypothetical protein
MEGRTMHKDESLEEYRARINADSAPVFISGVDIPFWDLAAIAIKLGVIWAVMGAIGYLVYRAAT